MEHNPKNYNEAFIFYSKDYRKVKILHYDINGWVVFQVLTIAMRCRQRTGLSASASITANLSGIALGSNSHGPMIFGALRSTKSQLLA